MRLHNEGEKKKYAKQNLITGTSYLNRQGMLDFENETAAYIKTTHNHVAYRVTPVFEGENLLADGVLWKHVQSKMEEKAYAIVFSAIMCSRVLKLIMKQEKTGLQALLLRLKSLAI